MILPPLVTVIGAGAAGMFAAIRASETLPARILVLEQSQQLLSKVKISGGGRCNVTHSCFDPKELIKNYPRGNKELQAPFTRFQPQDTVNWFESRGVKLKTEEDGRMFPITNDSQTIIDCIMNAAALGKVEIRRGAAVVKITRVQNGFEILLRSGEKILTEKIMLATGGTKQGHRLAQELGHTIVPPVPSLFTFNIPNSPLESIVGVSIDPVKVSLKEFNMEQRGPLLVTHWGLSGPAVLKLSAWAARKLFECEYQTTCQVDFLPDLSVDQLRNLLLETSKQGVGKPVSNTPIGNLPRRLWKLLVNDDKILWRNFSKKGMELLIEKLKCSSYQISGKTTYKNEFVTAGGVKLSEVNFKTMESRITPGLYFGGEILDIDGVTGGFNFQAAWTTGWLAGGAMANNA